MCSAALWYSVSSSLKKKMVLASSVLNNFMLENLVLGHNQDLNNDFSISILMTQMTFKYLSHLSLQISLTNVLFYSASDIV